MKSLELLCYNATMEVANTLEPMLWVGTESGCEKNVAEPVSMLTLKALVMTVDALGRDVGSALLPPCPNISVLSYSDCQRSTHSISEWIFRNLALLMKLWRLVAMLELMSFANKDEDQEAFMVVYDTKPVFHCRQFCILPYYQASDVGR